MFIFGQVIPPIKYFNSTEYVICEGGGEYNIPFQVFQTDCLSILLGCEWFFLIPRITLEVPARRWNSAVRFFTAIDCRRNGLGSNPGEGMGASKYIVSSWHGGTLNSRRATSSLVRLVEGEDRWEAPDLPPGMSL
ncbi:hypothetical protein TNCV_2699111 [Trichonephila clavipes]|nr:hypothetical protein TNCV_2699111 [Trichonephila clavipes]